ncbi:MAG TPA: hypothetical protein VHY58_14210 [Streptosporangiaceae bacterium]|jgi:hypothetical protein|nr:hypothetical protein [Streptosporangiaceae bacterium]
MGLTTRYCHDCGREQAFDQPYEDLGSCPDTLDGECPEWMCTGCGAALVTGVYFLLANARDLPPGRAA